MMWKDPGSNRRERWDRENAAPRLKELVPNLKSLRLSLVEHRAGRELGGTRRTQHVVVDTASTRFEVPCGESGCTGGGHDLTSSASAQLRQQQRTFSGSSDCQGYVKDRPCDRRLEYSFVAEYSAK
jgi:hypothetical protein